MTTHELLKARLKLARNDLDELLGHLNQPMMTWAPAAGVRTIAGQLVEIAATEMQTVTALTEDRVVTDAEAEEQFGDCVSLVNLTRVLAEVRECTLQVLDSYSEAELQEYVSVKRAWFATMLLPEAPRAEIFQSIAQHEWYHVGQLVSYLWIRGDNPYRW